MIFLCDFGEVKGLLSRVDEAIGNPGAALLELAMVRYAGCVAFGESPGWFRPG